MHFHNHDRRPHEAAARNTCLRDTSRVFWGVLGGFRGPEGVEIVSREGEGGHPVGDISTYQM